MLGDSKNLRVPYHLDFKNNDFSDWAWTLTLHSSCLWLTFSVSFVPICSWHTFSTPGKVPLLVWPLLLTTSVKLGVEKSGSVANVYVITLLWNRTGLCVCVWNKRKHKVGLFCTSNSLTSPFPFSSNLNYFQCIWLSFTAYVFLHLSAHFKVTLFLFSTNKSVHVCYIQGSCCTALTKKLFKIVPLGCIWPV